MRRTVVPSATLALLLLFCCGISHALLKLPMDADGLAASMAMVPPGGGVQEPAPEGPEIVPGEIIVRFRSLEAAGLEAGTRLAAKPRIVLPAPGLQSLNERFGLVSVEAVFPAMRDRAMLTLLEKAGSEPIDAAAERLADLEDALERTFTLRFAPGVDVVGAVAAYAADPNIEFAQPNYIYETQWLPDDYYYTTDLQSPPVHSWNQSYPDLWGVKALRCGDAWDLAQGEGVVVAVIDTGVDRNHPDLAASMWTNPGEIPGNSIDDDGNGYIDDVHGWDFINSDNSPLDDHGHGTHCAGTIAAVGNNTIGVIGVAPRAKIMALKNLGRDGSGPSSASAACIRYAAANGAGVLSNSWGAAGVTSDPVVESAIDYACALGCVVVVAAGNSNGNVANSSPANYAKAIAVAALDPAGRRAYFSNYGLGIDVSAPGVDVLSLRAANTDMYGDGGTRVVGTRYYRASGTSMACPHAAGAAALVRSRHPEWTGLQVEEYLTRTCESVDAANPRYAGLLGYGKVDAFAAVSTVSPRPNLVVAAVVVSDSTGNSDGKADPGETIDLAVTLKNLWIGATGVSAALSSADPLVTVVNGAVELGDIAAGASATATYGVSLSPQVQSGSLIMFTLSIAADDGYAEERSVTVPVPVPIRPGWPKNIVPSSITPVDLDGDGTMEVVVTHHWEGAKISVFKADGTPYGSAWPKSIGNSSNGYKDPSFGDLDGDGKLEIIVCPSYDYNYTSRVHALKLDGTYAPGWPVNTHSAWDICQAAVADIDPTSPGDEVAFTVEASAGSWLYVVKGNGQPLPGFPYYFGKDADPGHNNSNGCLALADLDNDGVPEILAATYQWYGSSSRVYAFNNRGEMLPGWPFAVPGSPKVVCIAAGDVDRDGKCEVIFGTWSDQIYLLNHKGQVFSPEWLNVRYPSESFAMGDLDRDGDLEIVIGPQSGSMVYALHHNAVPVAGWPVNTCARFPGRTMSGGIGDLDGDGDLEVSAHSIQNVWIWHHDGQPVAGADPIAETTINDNRINGYRCFSSMADLDGNGAIEFLGGIREEAGCAYVWNFPTASYVAHLPWPMQGHDPGRTNCYEIPIRAPRFHLSVDPPEPIEFAGPVGGPFSAVTNSYTLRNNGSTSLEWAAAETEDWLNLSSTGGTLGPGESAVVTAAIDTAALGMAAGSYSGCVTFTNLTSGEGSTARQVNLFVGDALLLVDPADGLTASRDPGAAISPGSKTYSLTNKGYSSLQWTAACGASWLDLSVSSGVLEPRQSVLVVVSFNPHAAELPAGTYSGDVAFTNTTNGSGSTTRQVKLSVAGGCISVTPALTFHSAGDPGGPFTPARKDYTLTNTGYAPLTWHAAGKPAWISLSSEGGDLAPGQSVALTLSINAAADLLPKGQHSGAVQLLNVTSGTEDTAIEVLLSVDQAVYVRPFKCMYPDGKSWETAFYSITHGLNAANPGQEVRVAAGDYRQEQPIVLKDGVALKGGYAGKGNLRDPGSYVALVANVQGASDAVIDGFTVTGNPAGVMCRDVSPTISNNVFTGLYDGVACLGQCSATIVGNRFEVKRGGIYCGTQATPTITDNVISGAHTGIVANIEVSAIIANNTIVGNARGVASMYSSPVIANNIIAFNMDIGAYFRGVEHTGRLPILAHNNVFGNANQDYMISDCPVQNPTDISADPMFVGIVPGDYRLQPESPCVDAGTPEHCSRVDHTGIPRPLDGDADGVSLPDIGCHEFARGFMSAAEAKSVPDGSAVALSGLVSTALLPDRFYAESADRLSGIGVMGSFSSSGRIVTVEGRAVTVDGERVLEPYNTIEGRAARVPLPWFVNFNALGGGPLGMQAGASDWRLVKDPITGEWERSLVTYGGANNIGLLVRMVGRITTVESGSFHLNGHCHYDDGDEGVKGVRVDWPFAEPCPAEGGLVEITGVSSCTVKDGQVVRMLRPVSADAVRIILP